MTKINPAALGALLRGDLDNFRVASAPGGIERQEAEGQRSFVTSETLPKECNYCKREQLEAMGIVFGDDVDDLFVSCKLPNGWKKVPTDHSMWSDLLDDKGRKRATIFYKAAFYDRSATISINPRFSCGREPEDRYKTNIWYEERRAGNWRGVVKDGDKIIFQTEPIKGPTFEQDDQLYKEAEGWLIKKYPDWRNPLSYWNIA